MQEKNGSGGQNPRTISNLLRVIIGVLAVVAVMLFIYFYRQRAFDGAWSFLSVLLPFLFVLTVVIFVHELGHFLVARWCGVGVKTFSLGFGKEIFGFNDRHGTRWRLAWIPLGGYVKFLDDENSASVPS
jgi:cell division protein FtsW (lipid II flippase)